MTALENKVYVMEGVVWHEGSEVLSVHATWAAAADAIAAYQGAHPRAGFDDYNILPFAVQS